MQSTQTKTAVAPARLAVLTHPVDGTLPQEIDFFYTEEGQIVRQPMPHDWALEDLFAIMVDLGIDQVWMQPGDRRYMAFTDFGPWVDSDRWTFKYYGEEWVSSVSGYCSGGTPAERKMRQIIWPEHTYWEWELPLDAPAMLRALYNLQKALGKLSSSPGVSGRNYIVSTLEAEGHIQWLTGVEKDQEEIPWKAGCADLAWKSTLLGTTGEEIYHNLSITDAGATYYLHAIDKNSMYLSAAEGLEIGIGEPVHLIGDVPQTLFYRPGPGLYLIQIVGEPEEEEAARPWRSWFDGKCLPSILYKDSRWVSAPVLKLLYDFDFQVIIEEAYHWTASRRILEKPARGLWNRRQTFRNALLRKDLSEEMRAAMRLGYESMKTAITSMMGLFASKMGKDKRYQRPDIWRQTIDLSKVRMIYNIDKIKRELDMLPYGVITDKMIFLTTEPDVHQALPGWLDQSGELGHFKHEYTLEVTLEVCQALAAETAGQMSSMLTDLAERQEKEI